ncbi:macrophage mannose receptor 1-like [Garra rufa]|uniref:macrophage mannose receptor 1-like n=1 Tax=Garra rufa TaxID=137080 RepID=UPI003CCED161
MDRSLFVLLLLSGLFWSSSGLSRPYHYINTAMSWSEAQSYCRERFTDLATVDSMDDLNRLVNIVIAGYKGKVWIGLNKRMQKHWVWSNGDDTLAQFSTVNGLVDNQGMMIHKAHFFCYNVELRIYKCFFFNTVETGYVVIEIYKNWTEAQSHCRKYHTDLATIRNKDDINRVSGMIPPNAWVWIGLFLDSWEWSDKWSRFFRNWAAGQPSQSSGSGDCVGMSRNDSGRWSQYSCDLRQPFICHGGDFYPRPYHYINTAMSWPEAQSYCRERFTDLATADNMDDVNRLVNIVDAGYSGSVWIGLKRATQKRWAWSNGENTTSEYYNWASGQPNEDGDCVATYSGVWHDMSCSYKRYFVCYGEFRNTGYIMVQSAKIWSDAQSYCRQHYTDLPTIHNSVENNQIVNIILKGWYIWFGLFRESWEWSDKWINFFRHWAAGQPFQSSGLGDCVGMSRNDSGKWAQYNCDLQQPFICHGAERFIKKQIIRLKVTCSGKCTLNDLSLQMAILNEISEKLKSMGLEGESKTSWIKQEGGEVFLQEKNPTANSNNKCSKQ